MRLDAANEQANKDYLAQQEENQVAKPGGSGSGSGGVKRGADGSVKLRKTRTDKDSMRTS